MKFLSRLFARKPAQLPAVITRILQPGYGDRTTAEQMRADHRECFALRESVRKNQGESAYQNYLRLLDSLWAVAESKAKLDACREAEREEREKLDAAYAMQQATANGGLN